MSDGLRLSIGTLTRVPVPAPRRVDANSARPAMLLAPPIGALVGAAGGLVVLAVDAAGPVPVVGAVLAVGLLAWLTRGMHWDGLADLADGLGSGADAERARTVMKDSAVGAFGVLVVVVVLLAQVGSLASIADADEAALALVVAALAGRLSVTLSTVRGVPAATSVGLGAAVAGCVPRWSAAGVLLVAAGATALVSGPAVIALLVGVAAGLVTTAVSVRRLDGITGDVLGAGVEIATAASLVASAVLAA